MFATRAEAEAELVDRYGALLTLVGKSTAADGTNPDLNGPIRAGLASLGLYAAASVVADSDLEAITNANGAQFIDVASLRLLRNVLASYVFVDQKYGQDEQKLSQARAGIVALIDDLTASVKVDYGIGLEAVGVGLFIRDFAEGDACSTSEFE